MNNNDNLKNKISKIFEAPIPEDEIPSTGSHYMSSDREFRIANKNVAPLLKLIHDYIKNMSWREISFDVSGSKNVVVLPIPLRRLMSQMYTATSEYHKPIILHGGTATRALNASEKKVYNKIAHFQLSTVNVSSNDPLDTNTSNVYTFKGVDGTDSRYYINMTCGSPGDRTHFPNGGINKGLKGLGQKLYRAIIDKYEWVQTNSGGSGIKDLMWDSLSDYKYKADGTRDTKAEIYSFRLRDSLFALSTALDKKKTIEHGFKIMNKVGDKTILASKQLRKENHIGIDADYILFLKANLEGLTPALKSKALEMINWMEPDPAMAAERKFDERP